MNKSKKTDWLYLGLPLFVFLLGVSVYEFRTGVIPNMIVYPAALVFLIAACIAGSKPWWHYLSGGITLFVVLLFVSEAYSIAFDGFPLFGGGTIKLGLVMGAALGIQTAVLYAVCYFAVHGLAALILPHFTSATTIPSVPISLLALGVTYPVTQLLGKLNEHKKKSVSSPAASPEMEKAAEPAKRKSKLCQAGLMILIVGGVGNAFLVHAGIGGLVREGMRLTLLLGLVLVIVGLIRRK